MRFRKLYGGIPNGVCFKAEFVGLSVHMVTDFEKNPVRISKDELGENLEAATNLTGTGDRAVTHKH